MAEQVIPFDEYSQLYEDIERLFEGFVTAAVTAIESRDPTTSGHSFRVATLTTGLAEMVDRAGEGPYRGLQCSKDQLRELRYAGLLHDFGKVGVREQVLVKQKKLYGSDLTLVRNRFQFLMQQADLAYEPTSRPSCPRARSTSWRRSTSRPMWTSTAWSARTSAPCRRSARLTSFGTKRRAGSWIRICWRQLLPLRFGGG